MITSLIYRLLSVLIGHHQTYGCVQMAEFQRLIVRIQAESAVLNHWIADKDASSRESQLQVYTPNC